MRAELTIIPEDSILWTVMDRDSQTLHSTRVEPSHFVAVGASAGGLEAIEAFFASMPRDTPFGFIIIQHLSPDYKSLMVEILSKKTSIPVQRAEDGMIVQPAHIYLIPPKKNLTIYHGTLMLVDQDHSRGLNLPIDVFFRSLAEDQGERAVAVILSGTGSDGMRGVRAVKQAGGMIMVQNEESARFDGMPRAAASTGLADFILPPGEMARELLAYTQHPYVNRSERNMATTHGVEDALSRIFLLLRERSKVDFSHYKPSTVVRRIERRIGITQTEDIEAYLKHLYAQPGEVDTLFRELLIGVTSFFRDSPVFDQLQNAVLPELLKSGDSRDMRVWVAGCSTGEEAYSLAIVIRECMQALKIHREVKIFATDIDRNAVRVAATGQYPESIAADVPPHLLSRYFIRQDDHFHIARSVREMVVFAQHNILKDPPFTRIDVVSCRNLLIYLQPVLQNQVLNNFSFSLRDNGILVLGTSETTGEVSHSFDALSTRLKIYRRSASASSNAKTGLHPTQSPAAPAATQNLEERMQAMQSRYGSNRSSGVRKEERILERLLEAAAERYLPTSIVVNEGLHILHVLGNTTPYFQLPSGRPSWELGRVAARSLSIPLTTAVNQVFREQSELHVEGVTIAGEDQTFAVNARIVPLPQRPGQEQLVAIFLTGAPRPSEEGAAEIPVSVWNLSRETEQRIVDLEQELQLSQENLQATVEELETSNEELQATNEELLASNEELQSTNEELQSTNEELYTVNAEYHSKIMELTELNNDLDNLLTSAGIGILLLDEPLVIRRFSPELRSIFNLRGEDVGRPVEHMVHRIRNCDPLELFRHVLATHEPREEEIETEDHRWFLMRVVPYVVAGDEYSGVVATFIDLTSIREAQNLLRIVADSSPVLIWVSDVAGQHIWFSEPWLSYRGRTFAEEAGTQWLHGVHEEDRERCRLLHEEHFAAGTSFSMEYRLQQHDGEWRWFLEVGKPRVDSSGDFAGFIGTCLDIHDRRADMPESGHCVD